MEKVEVLVERLRRDLEAKLPEELRERVEEGRG